ncbi:TSUP family transporter [Effusibacillus lacus]|uniref:TSUP family transporter n=1 Tax=Effusibacillus lacus TaxID=1348429 RepID=UPI00350E5608
MIHFMRKSNTYTKAVQLTRVLILGSCVGAFIIFYNTGFVQWDYAIVMAIGSALGSQIGLFALPHIPLKFAKALLLAIIFLLIGQVVFNII